MEDAIPVSVVAAGGGIDGRWAGGVGTFAATGSCNDTNVSFATVELVAAAMAAVVITSMEEAAR